MENIHRIEVGIASNSRLLHAIQEDLEIQNIGRIESVKVYTIEGGQLTPADLTFLAREVFSDPIIERYSIDAPLISPFLGAIAEIGFKPGVTDNVGITALQAIQDALNRGVDAVYSSDQYIFHESSCKTAEIIVTNLLANSLIQRWSIKEGGSYHGFPPYIPKVILNPDMNVKTVDLAVSDAKLMQISQEHVLALNLEEMHTIRDHYLKVQSDRKQLGLPLSPTDIELECIAQTWSEHCHHKIFNARIEYEENNKKEIIDSLFKTYIKKATEQIQADYLVSVFKDNAGVIRFNDEYNVAMKVETHNAPTALDPYGGALTGIVGCNRDPAGTGKGFKLIFNTDVFCFASPFYQGEIPPRLFHPRRVLKGVHKGVIDGGNQSGIPTVNGSLYFDPRYLGKPLVFVGTGGIAPRFIHSKPSHEKAPLPGDLVVMCGGRIGADGIHGATFSSLEINEHSPATAVQIGSPIVQKNLLDFLLEARDRDLFHAITDNGAGGLSSSVGEMGEEIGARIDLDKAPLKYPGLMPWEILISEAQERMTVAVSKDNIDKFLALSLEFNVESTVIGEFTISKQFQFYYHEKIIGSLPMQFLHHGLPQKRMKGKWDSPQEWDPHFDPPTDYGFILKQLLGRLNICSKEEAILRRYDHEVQGGSVVKPFTGQMNDGPSDAAVLKPLYNSWEGLVISHGICPRFSDIDTYAMAANAIDEAVRNAICVGADPGYLAGLDNFCWAMGFGETDEVMYTGKLVRANKALFDITTAYKVPCISGKDSMRNDYRIGSTAISVPPTLLFSVIGKIPDIRKTVSMDVKHAGDLIYILGFTQHELGGSEYLDSIGLTGYSVPCIDPRSALMRYQQIYKAIQNNWVQSCHDCSDGGLGVALAESAFAGGIGMEIDLKKVPHKDHSHSLRDDILLFAESASRLIVTIKPEHREKFEELFCDQPYGCIGTVCGTDLIIKGIDGTHILSKSITELKEAWQATLRTIYGGR